MNELRYLSAVLILEQIHTKNIGNAVFLPPFLWEHLFRFVEESPNGTFYGFAINLSTQRYRSH